MKLTTPLLATILTGCATLAFCDPPPVGHQPKLAQEPAGFDGVALSLERATPTVVQQAKGRDKTLRLTAWRGETVYAQCAVWTKTPAEQLRLQLSPLQSDSGDQLSAMPKAEFVQDVLADQRYIPDIADTVERVDLPASGYRAIWYSLAVPRDAKSGKYTGSLTARIVGNQVVTFPVELEVLTATLPKENPFFLDLWQHPFAVARYHDVPLFSPMHYALLEPIWRELAEAGQRTITVSIQDLPWGHQNHDPYWNFIRIERDSAGNFTYDFSRFDEYVAFSKRCGLGPDIHCYSIVTWGNRHYYYEKETGDHRYITAVSGSPEHTAFWTPFLKAFEAHVVAKGWGDCTFIALDERTPEETKAALDLITKVSPRLKVSMACNRQPKQFAGYKIDDFCVVLNHVDEEYQQEAQKRQKLGMTSTYYVCCVPKRPNTFTVSPLHDGVWLGVYAAAHNLSGFLRWAFVNWPAEPLKCTDYRPSSWPTGDTYLFYPNGRASLRWYMLKDGIEEARKLIYLKQNHPELVESMGEVLKLLDYARVLKVDDHQLGLDVEVIRKAIESSARQIKN